MKQQNDNEKLIAFISGTIAILFYVSAQIVINILAK